MLQNLDNINPNRWNKTLTYPEGYKQYMGRDGFWDKNGPFSGAFDYNSNDMLTD